MWRLSTKLEDFPKGFDDCQLALEANIFEASHTYKLKGTDKFLTVIEANGTRYYKAYIADSLDGEWSPIADTPQKPFAGWTNVRPAPGVTPWTDNSTKDTIRVGQAAQYYQGMPDKQRGSEVALPKLQIGSKTTEGQGSAHCVHSAVRSAPYECAIHTD